MVNSAAIAPLDLERAASHQCLELPDDGPVIERLFSYLERYRPHLSEIEASVREFYALREWELMSRSREVEVSQPRQIFCFLAYRHTRFSYEYIGRYARLHHTTVLHAVRKINRLKITQPVMRDDLDLLRLRISEKMLLRARGSC
jgi:chromosomal replication initiation ATPase DnaA